MTKGWLIRRTLMLIVPHYPFHMLLRTAVSCNVPQNGSLAPVIQFSPSVGRYIFNSWCAVRRDFECARFLAEQRVILWPPTVHRTERHATLQIAEDSFSHRVVANYEPDDPEQDE